MGDQARIGALVSEMKNPYDLAYLRVIEATITLYPHIPDATLDKITLSSDPTSPDGFSTNAAFIISSWLKRAPD